MPKSAGDRIPTVVCDESDPYHPITPEVRVPAPRRPKRPKMNKEQRIQARNELIVRDGLLCHWCSSPMNPQTATIEHLIPVSHGGSDDLQNLALACYDCNALRGNDTSWERSR